ncbi:AAA family ATPase, partial [Thermoanaerobacter thermohydrosulfuricus]
FGDLYIGKNPTKLKNSYMILKLNFSGLDTGNRDRLEISFKQNLIDSINGFLNDYQSIFKDIEEIKQHIKEKPDIKSIVNQLINEVKKVGKKVYLIIDEYDHFANDIIAMGDSEFYREIVRASGFV